MEDNKKVVAKTYELSDELVNKMVEESAKGYYDDGFYHGFMASQAVTSLTIAGGLSLVCAGLVGAGIAFLVDDICKEDKKHGSKPVQRK